MGLHIKGNTYKVYKKLQCVWVIYKSLSKIMSQLKCTARYPDSITLVGQRWQWAAGRRRFVTVGPPVAH